MRIKGTNDKSLQKLADSIPVPDGYADVYPTARRRMVEIVSTFSATLENVGLSLVIETPERPGEHAERLMRQHELTAAEARLAVHLAEGGTLADHAAEQKISRNTARTHLRAIFQKTGVNRQAALVRLVLEDPAQP